MNNLSRAEEVAPVARASFGFQMENRGFGSPCDNRILSGADQWHLSESAVLGELWLLGFLPVTQNPNHEHWSTSRTPNICAETQIQSCSRSHFQLGSFSTGRSFQRECRLTKFLHSSASEQNKWKERNDQSCSQKQIRMCPVQRNGFVAVCQNPDYVKLALSWTLIKIFRSSLPDYFPSWIFLLLYFFSLQFSHFNVS